MPRRPLTVNRLTGLVVVSRHGIYFEPPRWMSARWHLRLCSHCRGIDRYFREQAEARRG